LTRRIAIDCEFVGVGYDGKDNALARVSIVNQFGHVLLDTLVRPEERVVDYRTRFSGIRPEDLRPGGPARPFRAVHKEVAKLCQGRVLVGHSIGNDLKVLMISHPRRSIRDTSKYRPFRALFGGRIPSLRALTERVLGVQVQTGEHDSIEDARAAMRLYTSVKRVWESGKKGREAKALGFAGVPKPKLAAGEQSESTTQLNMLSEYEVSSLIGVLATSCFVR
ncbi:Exonuclease, partial [Fasciolopsis buskii]